MTPKPEHHAAVTKPPLDTPASAGHLPPPREDLGPQNVSKRTNVARAAVVTLLLTVVLVPPLAGFYSYFSGIPLHLLAGRNQEELDKEADAETPHLALIPGQPHAVHVPEKVCQALGIRKNNRYAVAIAQPPTNMRPLVLPGSTSLDPTRLAPIRARFAPARVVELGQVHDTSPDASVSQFRELRPGDRVTKGQLLGVFYSVDVGTKKNDLLDALVQLELDQKILDRVEENRYSVPEVFYLTQMRAVQGDRNAINRALNNLKLWDIPQDEIDALHEEAKKIASDKDGWSKTPEGIWVKGGKLPASAADKNGENPWGRVTLRAPIDGVIVERNVHLDEMVVDNTVNLFQIADVDRLLVVASCPEDDLPNLEALSDVNRKWTVRTAGAEKREGLPGPISEIGYLIDPNQHTAVIKGYVENPGKRIRAGQFVSATVRIPPPRGVVEIPIDALVDDGKQSLVFIQPDPKQPNFAMRRVKVTQRFEHTVFIRSDPIDKDERLPAAEAEEGLLPKEPLVPGDRVIVSGAVELKAAIADLDEVLEASQPPKSK